MYAFFIRDKILHFKQEWILSLQKCLCAFPVLRYSLPVIIPQLPECIIYNIALCKSTRSQMSCTHPAGYHCHSELFPVNTVHLEDDFWAQRDSWVRVLEAVSYKYVMRSKYRYRHTDFQGYKAKMRFICVCLNGTLGKFWLRGKDCFGVLKIQMGFMMRMRDHCKQNTSMNVQDFHLIVKITK